MNITGRPWVWDCGVRFVFQSSTLKRSLSLGVTWMNGGFAIPRRSVGLLYYALRLGGCFFISPAPDMERLIRFYPWWDMRFEWSISGIEGESLV